MKIIYALLLGLSMSYAQNILLVPGTNNNQATSIKTSEKIEVTDEVEVLQDGIKFPDGSRLRSVNTHAPLPMYGYLLPIYAKISSPVIQGDAQATNAGIDFTNALELHGANFEFEKEVLTNGTLGTLKQRPFLIKKSLDKASIPLIQAMFLNQTIGTIEIFILQKNSNTGGNELRFKYTFQNAKIMDIQQLEMLNGSVFQIEEQVKFIYSEVLVEDLINGIVFTSN